MKWVSRNETAMYNITVMGNKSSTYDGSIYSGSPGTNYIVRSGAAYIFFFFFGRYSP
jgi:hypothetical protein